MTTTATKQQDAERKIGQILGDLEAVTGSLVENIEIKSIDITTLGDEVQQLSRRVLLTIKPIPGSHWNP